MNARQYLIFGLITSGALSITAQIDESRNQRDFIVQSAVKAVSVEADKSGELIRLELRNDLINKGATPIILWKPFILWEPKVGLDSFREAPYVFTGLKISRDPAFAKKDILDEYYGGPSASFWIAWENMRKALDQAIPPSRLTRIVLPAQSLTFDSTVTIVCNKKPSGSIPDHPTFNELQEAGTLWLRVYYETWSLNLERDSPDAIKRRFGHKLQERWKKYGKLLLDDMYSEPIKIELKEATYKNREN